MKINRFTGINNVLPEERLVPDLKNGVTALTAAVNVDLGLSDEVARRDGFDGVSTDPHGSLWETEAFVLAVKDGDLVRIVDGTPTVLVEDVTEPVRYANWPDGRVAFSDQTNAGLVALDTFTGHGVPTPTGAGTGAGSSGGYLPAGAYSWQISYVRSDGLEGAPFLCPAAVTLTDDQKFDLTALPNRTDHTIRIYLTHHNGAVLRLAGETANDSVTTFSYTGKLEDLVRECLTEHTDPAPAGSFLGFWRGRALSAVGSVLFASRHIDPEHFALDKDHKILGADITLVQPVDAGIFVGTTQELVFFSGQSWDQLAFQRRIPFGVVPGSGVTVPGQYLKRGDGTAGQGDCFMAICGGHIVAGYQDGACAVLTQGTYRTDAASAEAAFRVVNGISQYLAAV